MTWMQWPALVTWLTLILLTVLAFGVSRARGRYGVPAPATGGNDEFERVYRVHMNTLESTVIFLPALWLAASYWKPALAALIGAVWLIGRIWYAVSYQRDPKRRSSAYGLSVAACIVLVVSSAVGWVRTVG
jgi:glutathione S-transferase